MAEAVNNLNTEGSSKDTTTLIDKIQLKDGTVLNLPLNGNTYESEAELPASLFSDENLSSVKINDIPKGQMVLICCYPYNGGTRFALRELTADEKRMANIQKTIAQHGVGIDDLEMALVEVYEMIVGGM